MKGSLCFRGMMVLQLVWVKFMVPESKGVPLEEIEHGLMEKPSPDAVAAAAAPARKGV